LHGIGVQILDHPAIQSALTLCRPFGATAALRLGGRRQGGSRTGTGESALARAILPHFRWLLCAAGRSKAGAKSAAKFWYLQLEEVK